MLATLVGNDVLKGLQQKDRISQHAHQRRVASMSAERLSQLRADPSTGEPANDTESARNRLRDQKGVPLSAMVPRQRVGRESGSLGPVDAPTVAVLMKGRERCSRCRICSARYGHQLGAGRERPATQRATVTTLANVEFALK
jgi:hypothetical protein